MKNLSQMPKFNPLISVIIPCLNEAENICACIQSAEGSYPSDQVEIIVVDGESTDETLSLIPEHITVFQTQPNRARQMNMGAKEAKGDIFVFCHADTQLPKGWREKMIASLEDTYVVGGAFQSRLEPDVGSLKWMNLIKLPKNWRFMYGDQGMFVRRTIFEAIGGFPEVILMEDVELARGMAEKGKVTRVDLRVITDSRRMVEKGVLNQIIGNAWRMIRYLYFQATPEEIASTYRSSREETI